VASSGWKNPVGALKRKQFMNLFWTILRNMTALGRFESAHRFKTLLPCVSRAA
jgi:hypothetical protein